MPSTIATVVLAVAAGAGMGQSAEPRDSSNCAAAVQVPAYPRLARLANISGTVSTHFIVREDGRADEVQFQGHPILAKEVEAAIGRTRFPETCRAKAVDVIFIFRLEGEPADGARTSVLFDSKYTYVVKSNATGMVCALEEVKMPPNSRRSCSIPSPFSRRIVSNMGIVEFRVPRSAPLKVSRDVDYVVYRIQYGAAAEKPWLTMMFGTLVGGDTPKRLQDSSIKWSDASKWSCSGIQGGDRRGTAADGRRWRHVNIPLSGYAAYEGVPQKAADFFDRILDSMCCGECGGCK